MALKCSTNASNVLLIYSKPHTLPAKAAHGTRQADETSSGVEISEWMDGWNDGGWMVGPLLPETTLKLF